MGSEVSEYFADAHEAWNSIAETTDHLADLANNETAIGIAHEVMAHLPPKTIGTDLRVDTIPAMLRRTESAQQVVALAKAQIEADDYMTTYDFPSSLNRPDLARIP
ncbi:hypothetical protein GCM10010193_11480 [Kitasatospora atroaurantiaca]|uniref:Uncharacterized protein n=2 Tax=Kitasatospora atroaurantiaca TaxID=285545 RepID=A0A561EQF7_9ACTN|nr:hypothetical protein [Kitasatospora atroaurantiaca]TWE17840.1 hypothetical protein FB465_2878 [Kitasatospora atroaurantiaca]